MRTVAPILAVLAIAVAGSMLGMAGFYSAWGAPAPQTDAAQDQLGDNAGALNPNDGPVEGPVSSGESDVVGLIANGLGSITDLAGAVIVLPITLVNLGFPLWFALPVGSLAYLIAGVGVVEWATNREFT